MKSNLKSYRTMCCECFWISKVTAYIMDSHTIMLYCKKCLAHTQHKKVD